MTRVGFFIGAVLLALCAAPQTSFAQHMDKALFLGMATGGDSEQRGLLAVYLRGLLNGFESTEIILRRDGRAPLYCHPSEPPLDSAWLEEALLKYYGTYPNIPENVSVGVTAVLMLRELFPCPEDTLSR